MKNQSDLDLCAIRILAVVVLYKMVPGASPTLKSLLEATSRLPAGIDVSILLWDNTPGGQQVTVPAQTRYIAHPRNPGLATAYNAAVHLAVDEGFEWLLTLDQDTVLPPSFLFRLGEIIAGLNQPSRVAAIVPLVTDGDRTISPYRLMAGAIPRWYPADFYGIAPHVTYAVNSASTLRISALRQVEGYDPLFPLDLSDINLFHKLHAAGLQVFLATGIRIHHELALLNKKERMNLDRYRDGLFDECAFYDMHLGALARLERLIRLAGRAGKDWFRADLSPFRKVTLEELSRRLKTSRASRLRHWKRWAEKRADINP